MSRSQAIRGEARRVKKYTDQLANPVNLAMVKKIIAEQPLNEVESARFVAMPKLTRKLVRFVQSGRYDPSLASPEPRLARAKKLPQVVSSREERAAFYSTPEWRRLRYMALRQHGGRCQACGRAAKDGIIIHVDHVKPIFRYPELKLEITNLQVLCEDCNLGKGAWDETDWRGPRLVYDRGEVA